MLCCQNKALISVKAARVSKKSSEQASESVCVGEGMCVCERESERQREITHDSKKKQSQINSLSTKRN